MNALNQTALVDVLLELTEAIERVTNEVEKLKGTVYEDDRLRERYLAGVKRPDADIHESAIRVLHQRLVSIGQEMRK